MDWKLKLAAYLHDPPSKCLDICTHGERSDVAFRQAGFIDEHEIGKYFQHADHTGAAADRLPFPQSRASGLQCAFDGVRNTFRHPLSGESLPFHAEFKSVEEGFEGENSVQPALTQDSLDALPDEDSRWRARFFAHWRLWPKHAMEKDYRFAFLPADTRIPDHSIWTHMQVVSALAGCVGDDKVWKPAFLKFQIGPVQDFIAAARSTRDLWSGSYLLSWLMAAGLKRLSELVGPDAVIYPNLRDQPLFDLHWKKELWMKIHIGNQPVWDSILPKDQEQDFLTPNLPNVFLALVPKADGIIKEVESAVKKEFVEIAESVWAASESAGLTNNPADTAFSSINRRERFNQQIESFLSLTWQITPWPGTIEEVQSLVQTIPLNTDDHGATLRDRVESIIETVTQIMPEQHRDKRFYADNGKTQLNNLGTSWALLVALNSWQLDSVRQTRVFRGWSSGGWRIGTANNKDSLTGKDEAVTGGRAWLDRCNDLAGRTQGISRSEEYGSLANRFKHSDWLGAITLIKRLWDLTYLYPKFGLEPPKMPNSHGLARHDPFSNEDQEANAENLEGERYFAALAFDGDEIGKWVAGDKCPQFKTQLADYQDGSGNRTGALEYFLRDSNPDGKGMLKDRFAKLLDTRRPVSPAYHLQFSEALSNFALHCARQIVEVFDGRLIYSGGDDVLALLPADTALDCAHALQLAFTGSTDLPQFIHNAAERLNSANVRKMRKPTHYQNLAAERKLFESTVSGFVARKDICDQIGRPIPFLVPGPAASASVGIAIAHFKAPLQDVVRAAQAAEKRSKRDPGSGGLGRKAVAVTLMKRSGEIIEWGAKWKDGLEFYRVLTKALEAEHLSAKFPHRFAELLEAYVTDSTPLVREQKVANSVEGFPVDNIIRRELEHCLSQQRGMAFPKESAAAMKILEEITVALEAYLRSLDSTVAEDTEKRLRAVIGLCQTVAFAHRTTVNSSNNPEPTGSV